ncbi:MAG: hypothetical protein OEZ08_04985 [Betaproteobacteria bacterium]|nr:hypothetical protein [Betaproteobacteria bacterium]
MADDLDTFLKGLSRFAKHLPAEEALPVELLVLRGHHLVEEELREVVRAKFIKSKAYDLRETKYSTLLRLAQALYGDEIPDWKWRVAHEVNVLRNSLAHHLEDETVEPRIDRVCKLYRANDKDFAFVESTDLSRLAYCFADLHTALLRLRT